ncbi:MAG: TonB C-terminal domain-containing protein [Betaproteobacteria bacterium]|nr:TonB C-terminal domain-containing protein [Betaproteobacteria bacterium]
MEINPALRPYEEPGKWLAGFFAVLVHLLLIAVLFYGVSWQRKEPEAFEVALVRNEAPPSARALPPPPPPPPPQVKIETPPLPRPEVAPEPPKPVPKPEIALPTSKPEKKKPEPKPEPQKPEVKPEPKPKPEPKKPETKPDHRTEAQDALKTQIAADQKRMQTTLNREAERARQSALLNEESGKVASAKAKASTDKAQREYENKIRVKIRGNIVLPSSISGNPEARFMVEQLPSGEVMDVKLLHSSGNAGLDTAIERAIRKSSPLPLPSDPSLFERQIEIRYRPFEDNP